MKILFYFFVVFLVLHIKSKRELEWIDLLVDEENVEDDENTFDDIYKAYSWIKWIIGLKSYLGFSDSVSPSSDSEEYCCVLYSTKENGENGEHEMSRKNVVCFCPYDSKDGCFKYYNTVSKTCKYITIL